MIYNSGLSEIRWILRILLLFSFILISACGNDEITKPQVQPEATEPPLPVRDWYPSPKHLQQPRVYVPVPITQQPLAPAYQGNVVQQPWGTTAQQPVYSAPQTVYPAHPSANQQQPMVWSSQQPMVVVPQTMAPQYQYQYSPRPWGDMTQQNNSGPAAGATDAWPQTGYMTPWDTQGTGSSGYWLTPGQTGQTPGTAYYGTVW
jgi:hypothetical protein